MKEEMTKLLDKWASRPEGAIEINRTLIRAYERDKNFEDYLMGIAKIMMYHVDTLEKMRDKAKKEDQFSSI